MIVWDIPSYLFCYGRLPLRMVGAMLTTDFVLKQLTACIHGSAGMLYPMYWQHVYIPVLPQHLIDYCWWVYFLSSLGWECSATQLQTFINVNSCWFICCSAPMPYLIGVHTSLMEVGYSAWALLPPSLSLYIYHCLFTIHPNTYMLIIFNHPWPDVD